MLWLPDDPIELFLVEIDGSMGDAEALKVIEANQAICELLDGHTQSNQQAFDLLSDCRINPYVFISDGLDCLAALGK